MIILQDPRGGERDKRQGGCDWLSLAVCLCLPSCVSEHPSTSAVCPYLLSVSAHVFIVLAFCRHVCFSLSLWLTTICCFPPVSMFQISKPQFVCWVLSMYTLWLSVCLSYLSTCASLEPGSLCSGWRRSHGLADPTQWSCDCEDACFPGGGCDRGRSCLEHLAQCLGKSVH